MFCSKCGTQVAADATFCSKCGAKITQEMEITTIPVQKLEVQKYATEEVKEYLSHAKTLEVNRYTLITAKNRLQQIINSLGHSKSFPYPVSHASDGFSSFWSIFWKVFVAGLVICVFVCGDADDHVFANIISIVTVVLLFFNTELLIGVGISLAVAFVISLIICTIRSFIKRVEYQTEVRAYHRQVEEDKKRVARENQQIQALRKQQTELGLEISKIDAMLQKLYALDVIYPKYRELVPIVTMYEYFDCHRCYDLVGPTGAYNLYEQESRQNIIISNLNQVVSMLSRIERNQHALYEAIQESNYYAEQMCSQANAMLKSSRAIEQNTAIAAYNAKVAAENSTISAYIDVCNL